jgi:hypothetical protein
LTPPCFPPIPKTGGKRTGRTAPIRPSTRSREAIRFFFIQESFEFADGQVKDTAEYPFGGFWSNEWLNEKPQTLTARGFLRGAAYIAQRNALIEALRIRTDDDHPGYIDLPFWGRFPVVVGDDYHVSEKTNEQGQCALSITFTRAGVSATGCMDEARTNTKEDITIGSAALAEAAVKNFKEKVPETVDTDTLLSVFLTFLRFFLSVTGKVQAVRTKINALVNTVTGIMNLTTGIIRAPGDLAIALINAYKAVVAGIAEIKNSLEWYGGSSGGDDGEGDSPASSYPPPDSNNEKDAPLMFLSVKDFSLDLSAETDAEQAAIAAMENLFRIAAFAAAVRILPSLDRATYQRIRGYWNLLERLAESIDTENPLVYAALTELRIAVS